MRRLLAVVPLLAVVLSLTPAAAGYAATPDSAAPLGAGPDWLPAEEWVNERYIPYDVSRVEQLFGMTRSQIYSYLYHGDRNLLELAALRGVPTTDLAAKLLEPRRASLTAAEYVIALNRANRTLTQGHLSEHLIGHVVHQSAYGAQIPAIFGISNNAYYLQISRGLSAYQIGQSAGIPPAELRRRVVAAFDAARNRGIATKQISPAEAATQRGMTLGYLDVFLNQRRAVATIAASKPVKPTTAKAMTARAASARPVAPTLLCHFG